MSKKFGFISKLEEEKDKPKVKYQVFEAGMGFERAQVLIPLEKADDFANVANRQKPKSRPALNKLAEQFGGYVE